MIAYQWHLRAMRLLPILFIVALTGCYGTEMLPTIDSMTQGGRTQFITDRFGVCWPGDFDRSAVANPIPAAGTNEFILGYHNHVRPGQSCNTQESFAFAGGIRFGVQPFHDRLITRATLRLDRRNTTVPVSVTGGPAGNTCMLDVEIADTRWWEDSPPGTTFASHPMPATHAISIQQDRSTIGVGVDVTWAVQQWSIGRVHNFGFVIKPHGGDIGKNENTCTGYWSNPRLEITAARPAPAH